MQSLPGAEFCWAIGTSARSVLRRTSPHLSNGIGRTAFGRCGSTREKTALNLHPPPCFQKCIQKCVEESDLSPCSSGPIAALEVRMRAWLAPVQTLTMSRASLSDLGTDLRADTIGLLWSVDNPVRIAHDDAPKPDGRPKAMDTRDGYRNSLAVFGAWLAKTQSEPDPFARRVPPVVSRKERKAKDETKVHRTNPFERGEDIALAHPCSNGWTRLVARARAALFGSQRRSPANSLKWFDSRRLGDRCAAL